ncbi:MAG: aromatic-ring-hydroxylating dioxygenase subunit beta [Burkholderiales bacterium]|nr:aromatic-ring-hydroxylating dioxygenase subunit beta [Burkholderiales bacterium]
MNPDAAPAEDRAPHVLDTPALHHAVTQFVLREARLLDEGRLDAWLDLFAPDGLYWVPLAHGQTDMRTHASLFHEDALLRALRVQRLAQARVFSQQPPAHTVRVVGGVMLDRVADDASEVEARSTLHLVEARGDAQRVFGAVVHHWLRRVDRDWRIVVKRVDLVNCDAAHEGLELFF